MAGLQGFEGCSRFYGDENMPRLEYQQTHGSSFVYVTSPSEIREIQITDDD